MRCFNKMNFSSGNQMQINGVMINVPSNASVSVINGQLYVNGKKYDGEELENKQVVHVTLQGDIKDIDCVGSVTVNGSVNGSIECGGSVTVDGSVDGSIDCGGSCTVLGNHQGRIDAGGSVITK